MLDSATLNTVTRNAWGLSFGGGVDEAQRTPATVLHDAPHRQLRKYGPVTDRPVLLVPPLAAPASCYDHRPGQSLVAQLIENGRTPYVVDYGTMGYADRGLGFEDWIDDIVPDAILRVSEQHDGSPVDVIGWSLGGTLSLLTCAAHPELPIRAIAAIGTPIDYRKIPALAPLRAIGKVTGDRPLTAATRVLGGLPAPLVQLTYRASAFQRELGKPWFIAKNLHDTETLARMDAIDQFMADMPGYPGRFFDQVCRQLILRNSLNTGRIRFGDRVVELAEISAPVLAVGGTTDVIAPIAAVEAITRVATGTAVRFETAPGSHFGLLAGPEAQATTWAHIERFFGGIAG